jgi:transcriptional regulator with XRE-family HTH domain
MRKLARMTIASNEPAGGFVPEWTVRDRFRKAREARGLTQEQFAEETGLSRRTISSIESGNQEPVKRDYNLWQLATGVNRTWLESGWTPRDLNPEPTGYGTGARVRHLVSLDRAA